VTRLNPLIRFCPRSWKGNARLLRCVLPFLLLGMLAACAGQGTPTEPVPRATQGGAAIGALDPAGVPMVPAPPALRSTASLAVTAGSPADLTLKTKDVKVAPLPLQAGFPFTVTAMIHNNSVASAVDVPVMVYLSASREGTGYAPFLEVLTVTIQPTQTLAVQVPVRWNLSGGAHQLWVRVNRLPQAWQHRAPIQPEADITDNVVLLELMLQPFDAYTSPLCPGRVDVEIGPLDVLPEPDRQQVLVRVHNTGNRALYNLPVVVLGDRLLGLAYTPAIPPCGGTAEVTVDVDRPLKQGEKVTVQVNPREWLDGLAEDEFDNNVVTVSAGLSPGMIVPPGTGLEDYDFEIGAEGITSPETWIILVTVHNLGTRDAAMVPIRVENAAGRKITDAIPLVQGNGQGVAAIRVGYLWTRGGKLTITVNPAGAKGAYPESHRENNVAMFNLP